MWGNSGVRPKAGVGEETGLGGRDPAGVCGHPWPCSGGVLGEGRQAGAGTHCAV